jgi:Kef-type K+ transport system membrane component KefB
MSELGDGTLFIFLVGVIILITLLIKAGLSKTVIPPLVGYLLLGIAIRTADYEFGFLKPSAMETLHFLSEIGLFAILFKVGMESKLGKLLGQLKRASLVWAANIGLTIVLSYLFCHYLLDMGYIPSLVIATAFTATSVGVAVAVWQEAGAMESANGSLLLDVAELDDISAIVFMALLFALLPVLHGGGGETAIVGTLLYTGGFLLSKLVFFTAACALLSIHFERKLTAWIERTESAPDSMLMITGLALTVAALAGLLGFSLAVGAFMAGLIFSRDPDALKIEPYFVPLHDFFAPFFFIGIGLEFDPSVLSGALGLGLWLTLLAIGVKVIANGLPIWIMGSAVDAALIGVSMTPRAEIAMVIMQQGHRLGDWAVSAHAYGAMIVVSLATCIFAPPVVRAILAKWPVQKEE